MRQEIGMNLIQTKPKKYAITKASELIVKLDLEPEPQEIWNGIYEGSKGLIVGVAKTGKTTFAENLAISIAVGKAEFFGYPLRKEPQKVLFINLEESYRIRTRRAKKQISQLSYEELELFNQNFISTPDNFPEYIIDASHWEDLGIYIDSSGSNIVIIDSLSHMINGQIESSENCSVFNRKFRKYVTKKNKTVIVIHHNIKGNDRPMTQDSIAGSRMVTQEFEYGIGMSNVPYSNEKYMSVLFNKYMETDCSKVTTYEITKFNWVQDKVETNVMDLYNNDNLKTDLRLDSTNKEKIYEYIFSKYSQDSIPITTSEIFQNFVSFGIMSKMTMHENLKKLIGEGAIQRLSSGKYEPLDSKNHGK